VYSAELGAAEETWDLLKTWSKDEIVNGRCRDLSQTQLKKEAHCCLGQKGEATYPDLLGKEELAVDWGKENFQAQCMRDY
jgi:hypothetical protein